MLTEADLGEAVFVDSADLSTYGTDFPPILMGTAARVLSSTEARTSGGVDLFVEIQWHPGEIRWEERNVPRNRFSDDIVAFARTVIPYIRPLEEGEIDLWATRLANDVKNAND